MDAEAMARRLARKPQFKDRNRDLGTRGITNKRVEQLKEKVYNHVQNIDRRHKWLEASKRHNYIQEYDKIRGWLSVLNKDHNAIGIQNLKDRMSHLRSMAQTSLEEHNHPIYTKAEAEIKGPTRRRRASSR